MAALLALLGGLVAPAGASAATWAPLGETPATGHGVFRSPQAIATSPDGQRVFVADELGAVVQRFSRDGVWEADLGWYADHRQPGRLGVIGGLATDRDGHVLVLDSENDRVQVFDADSGRWLGSWGTRGTLSGQFRLGRDAGAGGIAIDQPVPGAPTIVYVADQNNHRIQAFSLEQHSTSGDRILPRGARETTDDDVVPVPAPAVTWGRLGSCTYTACSADGDRTVLDHPQGIAVDEVTHNVFVADEYNDRVVEYRPDGTFVRQVGSYGYGTGRFRYPYDVSLDAREPRRLYVADRDNHRVQAFGAGTLGFAGLWGAFGSAPGDFAHPGALAAAPDDPAGGVAVADTGNDRVQVFAPDGRLTARWGIAGRGPGYVTRPGGVALDGTGRVHVADTLAHRVQRLAPDGAYLGQTGYVSKRSGLTAPAAGKGHFDRPQGIASDPARDRIWVADTRNHRVQELTVDGAWIADHRGLGFRSPQAVAAGSDGALLVADTGNHRIQRRDPATGTWTTLAVGGETLNRPTGVAAGADGDVYVADTGAARVLRVASGLAEPLPGTWAAPGGLALHGSDLYVADTGASLVLRQDVLTGAREVLGTEGPGLGEFVSPAGVAITPDGSTLVVADTGNDRVQRLQLTGVPPSPTQRLDVVVDGPGTVTSAPAGIACDTDCRQSFSSGAGVTLIPTPRPGAVFTGWAGACAGVGSCTATVARGTRVRASFAPAPPAPLAPPPPAPAPAAPAPPRAAPPASPPRTGDRTPPRITSALLVPRRFSPARRGALVVRRRTSGGAQLRLTLSEPAIVTLSVARRRDAAPLSLPRGTSRMNVTGRLQGRALLRGRHRLEIRAADAAGNSAPPLVVNFRVT